MRRDEKLTLPDNWEAVLEQFMLKRPIGMKRERVYICSPCRSASADGVRRNMKAARVYMFYVYIHFAGVPRAPHAYLPILLNDNFEDERALALRFGSMLLADCDKLFVCGDRLSSGMYGEITEAIEREIPVVVFNKKFYAELRDKLSAGGVSLEALRQKDTNDNALHFALTWGADKLAAYWKEDTHA